MLCSLVIPRLIPVHSEVLRALTRVRCLMQRHRLPCIAGRARYSGYLVVPAHVGRSCHAGGGNIIGFSRGKTLKADKLAKYGFTTPESVAILVRSGKVR